MTVFLFFNISLQHELQLQTVTANNDQFKPTTNLLPKMLAPLGKFTLHVVLLPRVSKKIEATMVIHADYGRFIYSLSAVGVDNKFGFRPIRYCVFLM
jgi:hypothetical protein